MSESPHEHIRNESRCPLQSRDTISINCDPRSLDYVVVPRLSLHLHDLSASPMTFSLYIYCHSFYAFLDIESVCHLVSGPVGVVEGGLAVTWHMLHHHAILHQQLGHVQMPIATGLNQRCTPAARLHIHTRALSCTRGHGREYLGPEATRLHCDLTVIRFTWPSFGHVYRLYMKYHKI